MNNGKHQSGFLRDTVETIGAYIVYVSFIGVTAVLLIGAFFPGFNVHEDVKLVLGYILGEMRGLVVGRGADSTFQGKPLHHQQPSPLPRSSYCTQCGLLVSPDESSVDPADGLRYHFSDRQQCGPLHEEAAPLPAPAA